MKTGRSTYVLRDTHQIEQRQGQRPTGSGLYGLEGGRRQSPLLNTEKALPLAVVSIDF